MSRMERKLVIARPFAEYVIAWLKHSYIPDPVYPLNRITSIYFDSPGLGFYHECLNGDIYKNKVRIRWYDEPIPGQDIPVYVELKSKKGFYTVKQRSKVSIPAISLREDCIAGIGNQANLDNTLHEMGYVSTEPLNPLILISYQRYRFRDRYDNFSITYDMGISSSLVEQSMAACRQRISLPETILELKGRSMEIPLNLQELNGVGFRWIAFSKYAQTLGAHLESRDSFGSLK